MAARVGDRLVDLVVVPVHERVEVEEAVGDDLAPQRLETWELEYAQARSAVGIRVTRKAVLDDRLKIVETFIPYKERIGESKLDVMKDGYDFLKTILGIGLFYKPLKLFFFCAFVLFGICLIYGVPLLFYYFTHHRILETDIYRIMTIVVMRVLGINLLMLGVTADEGVSIFTGRPIFYQRFKNRLLRNIFLPRNTVLLGSGLFFTGVLLNHKTIAEYFLHGTIDVHWSYVITGAFLILMGVEIIANAFMQKLLMMYKVVLDFRKSRVTKA